MRAHSPKDSRSADRARAFALRIVPPLAATCLALASMGQSAFAQSVSDYRLPEQTATQPPQTQAQGPVDSENPVIAPNSPRPAPTASPAPAPAPAPAPTIAAPAPAPAQAIEAPAPRNTAAAAPKPRATPTSLPSSTMPAPAPSPSPASEPTAQAAPEPQFAPTETPSVDTTPAIGESSAVTPAESPVPLWWMAIGAAVLALLAGLFLIVKKRQSADAEDEQAFDESRTASPATGTPQPAPPAKLPSVSQANAPTRPAPAAPAGSAAPVRAMAVPSSGEALPLTIGLEPGAMRLSLVFATLPYTLTVENSGDVPLEPLRILGDLGSAHASLSEREQLAPDAATLDLRHSVERLAPGESASFKGEFRLPLSSILQLRKGTASLFVPLVRLSIEANGKALRRAFIIGLPGETATAGLTPIRLDTGPRQVDELGAKEIEAARRLALDPMRQAG